MAAPKGNAYWMKRTKHGKGQKFSAASLQKACDDYFEWVEKNPLIEKKLVSHQGVSTLEDIPHTRAMTLAGLELHLGIASVTWQQWRSGVQGEDKAAVCRNVMQRMYEQKFTGAASGFYNANIIARDLGLADRQEVSGPNGGAIPITTTELTKEELDTELKKRGLPTRVFDDES